MLRLCKNRDGKPFQPLLAQLAHRIPFLGNPSFYACWRDEGLNHVLRTLAAVSHRLTFYLRIHASFNLVGSMGLNNYIHGHSDDPALAPIEDGDPDERLGIQNAWVDS